MKKNGWELGLRGTACCFHISCFFFPAQDPSMIKELLDAAFNLYQSSHIMSATKRVLMIFFANLVFSENPNMSR